MLPERLRTILLGPRAHNGGAAGHGAGRPAAGIFSRGGEKEVVSSRPSRGLEQFFSYIRDQSGLTILDLGGACQQNVNFITNLGHKLYSEDFLRSIKETFGPDLTDQSNPGRIEYFLRENLEYPEDHFDGVLVWDVLEYMAPPLLNATIERLLRIVRPKCYLLAFFHSDEKLNTVPYYAFRIEDFNKLQLSQHGSRTPAQLFNNRSLEKLFQRFESVKFFLTREQLREVIVKR